MNPVKSGVGLAAVILVALSACNTDPRVACKRYVDNGNKYFERGKYKEASLLYRRGLAKDAKSADAWYRLGLTNLKLVLNSEARRDFARAADLDPANTDALVNLGELNLLFFAADPPSNRAALADLKDVTARLLKRNRQSFDGLRFSAEIALLEHDLKTAIQKFDQANRVRPGQPEVVLSLAQALLVDRQDERAEQLAADFIARHKNYGPIYDLLYAAYLRTGRAALADQILKTKVDNNPAEGAFLMQLADHYYKTGRHAEMDSIIGRLTARPDAFRDTRRQVGDFYVRIHEFDAALRQYRLGQLENPNSKRIYQKKIAELLAEQGKFTEAVAVVAELLRKDSQDPEALALDATLLLVQNDSLKVTQAIARLEPLIAKLPGNALLHYNLGRAYLAAGQRIDQARLQFQEALKIDPKYVPARLSLAETELQRGESASAGRYADQVLTVDPSNFAARMIRARALTNMTDYAGAREELSAALRLNPKSADAWFELGQLHLKERRYAEAETTFQALRETGDARWLAGAVDAMIQRDRSADAIRLLASLLDRAPDRPDYRALLASTLFRAGSFAASAAQWQILTEKNPRSAELFLRLGESKAALHDMAGAIAAFQTSRALAPGNASADLDLALTFERAQQYNQARQAYQEVIRKQPDNLTALNNLAYLDADQGVNLDRALAYAQRVRARRPEDPDVIDTMALICIKKNLTDDGLRMLREALTRKPASVSLHLHLALALYQKGDRAMARRELNAALRNKPTPIEETRIKELQAKVG